MSYEGHRDHAERNDFATYTHLRGSSDRAIAQRTRHRYIATVGTYVRLHDAWTDNAATLLSP